jgi:thiol-disulfide isomerase/thioredoxin
MRNIFYKIIIPVVLMITTLILLTLIFLSLNKASDVVERNYSEFNYLPTLNYQQFSEKINNGDKFYVYIGSPDCGDSRRFHQEFEQLFVELDEHGKMIDLVYDFDNFYYFNIAEIIDATSNTELRHQFNEQYGFYFTPSLVAYEDITGIGTSEVMNIAEWSALYGFSISNYMNWFYINDLIVPQERIVHDGPSNMTRN